MKLAACTRGFVLALCLALCLAGCVPSLNSLYDDKTLTFSEQLLGAWKSADGRAHFLFTPSATPSFYRLVYVDGASAPVLFRAALARLAGKLYLDVSPEAPASGLTPEFMAMHISFWHTFARIDMTGSAIRLFLSDPTWLAKFLSAHPDALPHFASKGVVYVTAETPQMQAFVVAHDTFFDAAPRVFGRE